MQITNLDVDTLQEYIDDAIVSAKNYERDPSRDNKATMAYRVGIVDGFTEALRPRE